jgi:hypothetical protein
MNGQRLLESQEARIVSLFILEISFASEPNLLLVYLVPTFILATEGLRVDDS